MTTATKFDKVAGRGLVAAAMERGWGDLSLAIVQAWRKQGAPDLSSAVYQNAAAIRKSLMALTESLSHKTSASSGIAPAFQWAQSPGHILLNVKHSAKWDTPATLGCGEGQVTFPTNRTVEYATHCKDKRKSFQLKLSLWGAVNASSATWNSQSVGRATLTLPKLAEEEWPRLLHRKSKPGNMHVWWAMKEKHEQALKDMSKREVDTGKPRKGSEPEPAAPVSPTPEATPVPTPTPAVSAADQARTAAHDKASEARQKVMQDREKAMNKLDRENVSKRRAVDAKAREERQALDRQHSDAKEEVMEQYRQRMHEVELQLQADLELAAQVPSEVEL